MVWADAGELPLVPLRNEAGHAVLDGPLLRRLEELAARATTEPLILGGTGEFCRGLDLASVLDRPRGEPAGMLRAFAALLENLTSAPVPIVAVVDGPALGGGTGLAAVADLVVATPRARFALPEVLFGLIPAVVFPYVARRVGLARARAMALSGAALDAREALGIGLVDQVADDWQDAVLRETRRWSRLSPRARAMFRALLARSWPVSGKYVSDAVAVFSTLLEEGDAPSRIQRYLAGAAPWSGEHDE